jgi:hypothetical protein
LYIFSEHLAPRKFSVANVDGLDFKFIVSGLNEKKMTKNVLISGIWQSNHSAFIITLRYSGTGGNQEGVPKPRQ